MKSFSRALTRLVGPDIKLLLGPLLILIIVGLLSFSVGKNGFAKVRQQMKEFEEVMVDEEILTNKLFVLKETGSVVLDKADAVLIALPEQNPSIMTISNVRTFAKEKEIVLEEISGSRPDEGKDIKKMQIEISTKSEDFLSLKTFLVEIINSAPISKLQNVFIQKRQGTDIFLGEISLDVYWSPLPETLPQITEPIVELTSREQEIFNMVSLLKKPVFTTLEPAAPKDRPSPFN